MKRLLRAAVLVLGLVAMGAPVQAGFLTFDLAYMATQAGDFGTLNLGTGSFSLLGNSGVTLAGLAVSNGTLYGAHYNSTGELYSVSTVDGSVTTIGASAFSYDDFGGTLTGLYGVSTAADLYSIDRLTGAGTFIGSTGLTLTGFRALSNNAGTLYFTSAANLYTLDTSTGAATLVGSTSGAQIGALLYENGTLYGGDNTGAGIVDTVNTTTGAATTGPGLVGTTGQFYGLAPNPIPEPSVVWSVLFGGAWLLLARRSKALA